MQPTGGDMPGMPPSMAALHELQNGQPQQQQQQRHQAQGSALHDYDHSAAAAHDDFFDQMLSSLPWVELNPANSKSPWDLAAANGGGEAAGASAHGQKLFSVSLGGKPEMEEQTAGAEGLHYATPYDESALLASRLRQHQISGGGPQGKPVVPIQLNHASQQQQQHVLVPGIGRSAAAGDSGLLPLPLSLGSGDSADSRLLLDRSRGDVDPSFKSLTSAVGDGLFNGFGGSLQRAAPTATATQQNFHHPQAGAVPSQNLGAAGQAPAAGSAGTGAAPPRQRVRARRGQATDPHSIAERLRRERIAERMKALQELVPNANKSDKASMLDEIIDYVKFLQLQVKVLSMSRLGGAAAVVPLVADMSAEASAGRSSAGGGDGLTATEHQVAKMMEDDIGSAMQYLQGKGLCLMPISLASAISATTGHPRTGAAANLPNGGGGNNHQNGSLLVPHAPASNADAPSSPSMSVLTVQSAMANGGDASIKDAASVSKP